MATKYHKDLTGADLHVVKDHTHDADEVGKVQDGVKFYLSHTTETYWVYTGGKVELWVNGVKIVTHP